MNKLKLSRTTIIIGLLILVGAMFFLPRVLGSNNSNDNNSPNVSNPGTGNQPNNQAPDNSADLGQVVSASSLDRDGCAADNTTTFSTSGPIYVVAQGSSVQQGTTVFVRLYYQGQPIEDLPQITADQDYSNTCINFVFEPTQGAAFQAGQYEAQFIVNGNEAQSVTFQVQ